MRALRNLRRWLTWWEDWLFAAEDAAARHRGWEISRPQSGFGRIYRDPRWNFITECEQCGGEGGSAIESCQSCGGRGTVQYSPTDTPHGGAS
ncbi:MAG: hypothetical protein LC775_01205 [Acidobacteria bacterium]|nr:hypothetical protein [Acidobacteriota bacterium]